MRIIRVIDPTIETAVSLLFDLAGVLKMSTFIMSGYQVWCLLMKQLFSYVDLNVRSLYNIC